MRFFAVLFVLASAVAVKAQDLSEFDNKKGTATVKTECFVRDFAGGDEDERKEFEKTSYYGVDGELGSEISKQGVYVIEAEYTHEFDKDGRVTKRAKKETLTAGKGPAVPRLPLVWEYTYNDAGEATVVCKEVPEEKKDDENSDDPDKVKEIFVTEIWLLDSAGRVLEYSIGFPDSMLRTIYKRDAGGKLVTKTEEFSGIAEPQTLRVESYVYREDGTLKETEERVWATDLTIKKQYDPIGQELGGQLVDKDGKTTRQWTVSNTEPRPEDPSIRQRYVCYRIYGEDKEKIEMQGRYVITTTARQ